MPKPQKTRKSEYSEAWFRIVVLIVSGIILSIWRYLIYVLVVLGFLYAIFNGRRHKGMANLAEYWNTEAYKFFRYMTFVSNVRPFPFSDVERISRVE